MTDYHRVLAQGLDAAEALEIASAGSRRAGCSALRGGLVAHARRGRSAGGRAARGSDEEGRLGEERVVGVLAGFSGKRTFAGMPVATAPAGIGLTTTELAPICTSSPISMSPSTRAPAPMVTRLPTVGCRLVPRASDAATQRDAVVEHDVVTDDRGGADDDAHPVVDEEAAADLRAGVDLDPGDRPHEGRQRAGRRAPTGLLPDPVQPAVGPDRVQPGRVHGDVDARLSLRGHAAWRRRGPRGRSPGRHG